jgi:hypothetical protein
MNLDIKFAELANYYKDHQNCVNQLYKHMRCWEDAEDIEKNVITSLRLISKLGIVPADEALSILLEIAKFRTDQSRDLLSTKIKNELLFIKFLRSFSRLNSAPWTMSSLTQLLNNAQTNRLFSVSYNSWESLIHQSVGTQIRPAIHVYRGLTVARSEPPFETTCLGLCVYALDIRDNIWVRLRVVEHKPPSRRSEWDIGILTQNINAGKIEKEKVRDNFPGRRFPGLGTRVTNGIRNGLINLAQHRGICFLDVTPIRYELSFLDTKLTGAYWDKSSPTYVSDKNKCEYIEKQLDAHEIGLIKNQDGSVSRRRDYLLERSWYVFDGNIVDPLTAKPGFRWPMPRIIIETKQGSYGENSILKNILVNIYQKLKVLFVHCNNISG